MTLYENRKMFAGLSLRIGAAFSRLGLSPNQWTLISLVPAFIALYFLANSQFLYAAAFFIVSAFLDLVDGSVARVMGKVTKLGAYLDTLTDRYVEAFIVIGMLFLSLPSFYLPAVIWIFIFFLGSTMTTYAKAAAKEKDLVDEEIKGGLVERPERLVLLFIGILLASYDKAYLTYIIVLLAVLTNISALQRAYAAKGYSEKGRKGS